MCLFSRGVDLYQLLRRTAPCRHTPDTLSALTVEDCVIGAPTRPEREVCVAKLRGSAAAHRHLAKLSFLPERDPLPIGRKERASSPIRVIGAARFGARN